MTVDERQERLPGGPSLKERITNFTAQHRSISIIVGMAIVAALLPFVVLIPPLSGFNAQSVWVDSFSKAGIYILLALGLNVVVGLAGLLDLGYAAFFAIGAYAYAILASSFYNLHVPFWPMLILGAIIAAIFGIALGAPTLRLRGDYLAIVTLGFGEIIRLTAINSDWLGGNAGISNVPRPPSIEIGQIPHLDWSSGPPVVDLDTTTTFLKFGISDQIPYYWLALVVIAAVVFADILIKDSRVGRAWEATREDEDAAELMGVPTFKFKLLAFAMGAFIGGLSGALFAGKQGFISPGGFPLLLSILFIAAVVVGGAGNRWGVMLGAVVVAYFPERFREFQDWRVLVFGLALMLLAIFRPQGLLPPRRTIRAKKTDEKLEALEEGTTSA